MKVPDTRLEFCFLNVIRPIRQEIELYCREKGETFEEHQHRTQVYNVNAHAQYGMSTSANQNSNYNFQFPVFARWAFTHWYRQYANHFCLRADLGRDRSSENGNWLPIVDQSSVQSDCT